MRRAVILATFTCILFAVAGVTAARGDSFTSNSQEGEQTESTVPEPRAPAHRSRGYRSRDDRTRRR